MNLSDFEDKRADLYGADGNRFRVAFPGEPPRTFEAIEDEQDGYRSSLDRLDEGEKPDDVFPAMPVASVVGRHRDKTEHSGCSTNSADVLELVDDDGHVWLEVGTEDVDDYYPGFLFTFHPKAPR